MIITKHCDKHGDYQATSGEVLGKVIESSCPQCLAEIEAKEAEEKRAQIEAAMVERAKAMNLRPKYYYATLDSFDAYNAELQNAKRTTQGLIDGKVLSLLFVGPVGTGKTHLAAAALNAKKSGMYMTMYEISATIRASYSARDEKTELEIVNGLASVPLLVIDEIGRTKGGDTELNWLSYIIDRRSASGLPFILLSNKHLSVDCKIQGGCQDCIDNYFGEDIVSRLCEKGYIVKFAGNDYRNKRGEK